MPPQSAGRMDDVAANGCIFGQIRSSIYMTLQKILPAAESGYLLKERRKAFMRRNSFIEIERPPQPKPFILTEKYPRLKQNDDRLNEQNKAVFEREKKRDKLKKERSDVQVFNAAKKEYFDYHAACAEWEKIYGEKTAALTSIRDRLRQKEQIVKETETGRTHQTRRKDKV